MAGATLRTPWRLRLRAGLCVYAGVAIVYVGTLADLVHFFALARALPLGHRLAGRAPVAEPVRPTVREWWLLACAGLLLLALAEVVMWLVPGDGPFGPFDAVSLSAPEILLLCVIEHRLSLSFVDNLLWTVELVLLIAAGRSGRPRAGGAANRHTADRTAATRGFCWGATEAARCRG
ncbi:hypothetical protein ACWEOE_11375 [Amycolatopsis sp. NPDC004368]